MKLRRAFLGAAGALFLLWGIYTAVFGISQFRQELAQQDWWVSMATVTAVEQRWESSGGRHSSSKKVYDVTYEYAVNEESYTGELVGDTTPREVGDSFDVKVDPANPEISTAIVADFLSPGKEAAGRTQPPRPVTSRPFGENRAVSLDTGKAGRV